METKRNYYQENREVICARAREYSRRKHLERKAYLEEHPEERDAERERMKKKYYSKRAYRIKKEIDEWLAKTDCPDHVRSTLQDLLKDDRYKELTPMELSPFRRIFHTDTS